MLSLRQRDLMTPERSFNVLSPQGLDCMPSFGRPQQKDGPSRLDNRVAASSGLLDLADLGECPFHGGSEILVDVLNIIDDSGLVPIAPIYQKEKTE